MSKLPYVALCAALLMSSPVLAKGRLAGAAVGAAVGAKSHHAVAGAVVGAKSHHAVAGAVVGGAVGHHMAKTKAKKHIKFRV